MLAHRAWGWRRPASIHPRGEPDELVGAAVMLCSEAGKWITGQVIHIDGGVTAGSDWW